MGKSNANCLNHNRDRLVIIERRISGLFLQSFDFETCPTVSGTSPPSCQERNNASRVPSVGAPTKFQSFDPGDALLSNLSTTIAS